MTELVFHLHSLGLLSIARRSFLTFCITDGESARWHKLDIVILGGNRLVVELWRWI